MNHLGGSIILINGPSSSGKTTLALAAQNRLATPFLRFSFDLFLDSQALPLEPIRQGKFAWDAIRPAVFTGLHRCVPALARAGNNVIFDHIIESQAWLEDLLESLSGLDVFFVGLHCSLTELERRELQRGNRRQGDAQMDFQTVHRFASYDLELNSENALEANTTALIEAWKNRARPSAMDRMIDGLNPL